MMPQDLPPCLLCKQNSYAPRGASISPVLQQQGFVCDACQAHAELVSMDQCALLMFNPTDAHFDYVNGVVLSVWRDWVARAEKERSAMRSGHVRVVNASMGLPEGTTGYALIDDREKYAEWCKRLGEYENFKRDELRLPYALEKPVLPQVPLDMRALSGWGGGWGGGWREIIPATTQRLPIPPDPVRARHDAAFAEIFERVREATGILCEAEQIPNEYYFDKHQREPWYRFGVGDGTVVIGPRKRVIAIRGARTRAFAVSALRDVAKTDGVTWYNGDDWQGTLDAAERCEIHAWGQDKAVEYLTLLMRTLLE